PSADVPTPIDPPLTQAPQPCTESPPPLPPVESLTPESDFTPFMSAEVDAGLRRMALKTLFSDPRFNVMDRLDVYIDDYSQPDPVPEGWLEEVRQVASLRPQPLSEAARTPEEAGERRPEGGAVQGSAAVQPPDTSDPGKPPSKVG